MMDFRLIILNICNTISMSIIERLAGDIQDEDVQEQEREIVYTPSPEIMISDIEEDDDFYIPPATFTVMVDGRRLRIHTEDLCEDFLKLQLKLLADENVIKDGDFLNKQIDYEVEFMEEVSGD